MIFDPDAHLSIEEQMMKGYERLPEHIRTEFNEMATAAGMPLEALLHEGLRIGLDLLKDPIEQQRLIADMDRREAPYGTDPLLKPEE
jgi:hypothetical protein